MAKSLASFVLEASDKYIKGQMEHGGDFIKDVDHTKEMHQELIDHMWYMKGGEWKKELGL